jgi:hypothetical protein
MINIDLKIYAGLASWRTCAKTVYADLKARRGDMREYRWCLCETTVVQP